MTKGLGIIDEDALNIFTDGSSFPHKKRVAGIGMRFVWVDENGDEEFEDYSPPGWQSATIDEMEIVAVSVALSEARRIFGDLTRFKRILVYSDSRYVVDNFTTAMNIWPKTKWRKTNGMPAENIDLWKALRKEVNSIPVRIDLDWVKSHKKNIHNKAADRLAKESAAIPINKPISLSATSRKWSDRKTNRGSIPATGQTLKIRIIEREYVKLAKLEKYRYEVIDPESKNFKDVDFSYCKERLSRHKCYEVVMNDDPSKPTFTEVLQELNCADYKYV